MPHYFYLSTFNIAEISINEGKYLCESIRWGVDDSIYRSYVVFDYYYTRIIIPISRIDRILLLVPTYIKLV